MSTKYAILNVFGQQFKVSEGDQIRANRLDREVGTQVEFSDVVLFHNGESIQVGQPFVSGVKVTARLEKQVRGDKVLVFKYLRKNKHKKLQGHRQPYSMLKIESIQG